MLIKNEWPPNIEDIKKVLTVPESAVFPYGDRLYNNSGKDIPKHLMIHETVHIKQQNGAPTAWWDRYLKDRDFREEQEVEAYAKQYAFVKKNVSSDTAKAFLTQITRDLTDLYGLGLPYHKIEAKIRRKAKNG